MVGPGNLPGCEKVPACSTCGDSGLVNRFGPDVDWCPNRCHQAHALADWFRAAAREVCRECGGTGERVLVTRDGDEAGYEPCGCAVGGNYALAQAEEKAAGLQSKAA